jgi:hypothetical protein
MFTVLAVFAAWQSAPLLAAQGDSLHIGVYVQQKPGAPIDHLSAKDFVLSSQGTALPFKLIRPANNLKSQSSAHEPTRMLILLSPHIKNSVSTLNHLLPALDPIWQRRWQAAAVLSNGSRTGYATSAAQLQQMWTALENNPQPATGSSSDAAEAAVHDLDSFAGRRIVLYLANTRKREAKPAKQIASAAKDAMAQMFVVNGGVRVPSDSVSSSFSGGIGAGGGSNGFAAAAEADPSPIPSVTVSSTSFTYVNNQYDTGTYAAINGRAAILQATRTAKGYYSLRIPRAALATLPSGTPLSLQIHLGLRMDYTVMAMGYGNHAPQILLTKK